MKIEVTRAFPYGGKRRNPGEVFDIPDKKGKVFVAIKKAKIPKKQPAPKEQPETLKETLAVFESEETIPKKIAPKRRAYKRRDMSAEE